MNTLEKDDRVLQELALEIVRGITLADLEAGPDSPKPPFVFLCEKVNIRLGYLPIYPARMKRLADELVQLFLEKLAADDVGCWEQMSGDLVSACGHPLTERLLKKALDWRRVHMPTAEEISNLEEVAALG